MVDLNFGIHKTVEIMKIVHFVRLYIHKNYPTDKNSEEVVAMIAKIIYEENKEIEKAHRKNMRDDFF